MNKDVVTPEQLEHLAMAAADLPDGLNQPEQLFFLSLRCLYQSYRDKYISREAARVEKMKICKAFEVASFHHAVSEQTARMRNRLGDQLSAIRKGGCPECRRVVDIFDGFERGAPHEHNRD